jgi:hypothetical protein
MFPGSRMRKSTRKSRSYFQFVFVVEARNADFLPILGAVLGTTEKTIIEASFFK